MLYGSLYLLSLLPFSILYVISDLLYVTTYYIIGYRKDVVAGNLLIAFPQKTAWERKKIEKRFYRNLTDSFVETIKLLSISEKQFDERCSADLNIIRRLAAAGKNIQLQPVHQFNLEFYNLLYSKDLKDLRYIFIYMPFSSSAFERVYRKLRSRFGAVLIAATTFRNERDKLKIHHAVTLMADQNPGNLHSAFWMRLFHEPVPFISGPGKVGVKNNSAIVFIEFVKIKRGYYSFKNTLLTEDASLLSAEEITKRYRDFMEEVINKEPANYLWTHKRWKHKLTPEFEPLMIE